MLFLEAGRHITHVSLVLHFDSVASDIGRFLFFSSSSTSCITPGAFYLTTYVAF